MVIAQGLAYSWHKTIKYKEASRHTCPNVLSRNKQIQREFSPDKPRFLLFEFLLEPWFSPYKIPVPWDTHGKTVTSKTDAPELSTEFYFFISAHTLGIPSGLNYQTFSGIQPTSSDFKKGGECHRPSTRPCQLDVGLAKPLVLAYVSPSWALAMSKSSLLSYN